jgi:hypothetical protein
MKLLATLWIRLPSGHWSALSSHDKGFPVGPSADIEEDMSQGRYHRVKQLVTTRGEGLGIEDVVWMTFGYCLG